MSDLTHMQWTQRLIRDGFIPKQHRWLSPARARALLAAHISVDTIVVQTMTPAAYLARLTPAARIAVRSEVYGS
jgi:hypothetical protein